MSKETDIAISVSVKDGPKMQPQATKLPKDYCGARVKKAVNEEIELTPTKMTDWVSLDPGSDKIIFVAIHSDSYLFKDACGNDKPGVQYWGDDVTTKLELLDGPHVYVSRILQELSFKKLTFQVCNEMFSCINDVDKKKLVINVTYGVGELDTACKACDLPKPAAKGAKKKHAGIDTESVLEVAGA